MTHLRLVTYITVNSPRALKVSLYPPRKIGLCFLVLGVLTHLPLNPGFDALRKAFLEQPSQPKLNLINFEIEPVRF